MKKAILTMSLISVLACDNSFHAASNSQQEQLLNPQNITLSKFQISIPVHFDFPYTTSIRTNVTSDIEFDNVRIPAKAFKDLKEGSPSSSFMVSMIDVDLVDFEVINEDPASQFAKYPGQCSDAGFKKGEQICGVSMFPLTTAGDCNKNLFYPDDWVIKNSRFKATAIYKDNTRKSIRISFTGGCDVAGGNRKPQSLGSSQAQTISFVFGIAMFLILGLVFIARMKKT